MEKQIKKVNLHNEFWFTLKNAETGEIKQKARAFNIVLNRAYHQALTEKLDIRFFRFGRGTGELSPERTSLFDDIGRFDSNGGLEDNYVWGFTEVGTGSMVGEKITEIGVSFQNLSSVDTHALIEDSEGNPIEIDKTDTDILEVYARVYFEFTEIDGDYRRFVQGIYDGEINSQRRNYIKEGIPLSNRKPLGLPTIIAGSAKNQGIGSSYSFNQSTGEYDDGYYYEGGSLNENADKYLISGMTFNVYNINWATRYFLDDPEPPLFPVIEDEPIIRNNKEIDLKYAHNIEESEIIVTKNGSVLSSSEYTFNGNTFTPSSVHDLDIETLCLQEGGVVTSERHRSFQIIDDETGDAFIMLNSLFDEGKNVFFKLKVDPETLSVIEKIEPIKEINDALREDYSPSSSTPFEFIYSPYKNQILIRSVYNGDSNVRFDLFTLDENFDFVDHKIINESYSATGSNMFLEQGYMSLTENRRFCVGSVNRKEGGTTNQGCAWYVFDFEKEEFIQGLNRDTFKTGLIGSNKIEPASFCLVYNSTLKKMVYDETEEEFKNVYEKEIKTRSFRYGSRVVCFWDFVFISSGRTVDDSIMLYLDNGSGFDFIYSDVATGSYGDGIFVGIDKTDDDRYYKFVCLGDGIDRTYEFWVDKQEKKVISKREIQTNERFNNSFKNLFSPLAYINKQGNYFLEGSRYFEYDPGISTPVVGNITLHDEIDENDEISVSYALKGICPKSDWNTFSFDAKIGIQVGPGQGQ